MTTLWQMFLSNNELMIHKWAHYFPVYERHLSRFRDLSVNLLEIGTGDGGSALMWKKYFGPMAQIVTVDVRPECAVYEQDQIAVRIGSQSDPVFLRSVVNEFGPFDIVIDDGSHVMADIQASFDVLYPAMATNGVYLVEDLHTAYWPSYGGGFRAEASFIEFAKSRIDDLNAGHRGAPEPSDFSESTVSVHCYDSVVVFERGRHIGKRSLQTGNGI